MEYKAVIQIKTETYNEQQYIMSRFPSAKWIALEENKVMFYVSYGEYNKVKEVINEWEKSNE